MVEMNTTPLIDVMLVLLTLLIITLPIQTHAVKLDMPQPNQPPPTDDAGDRSIWAWISTAPSPGTATRWTAPRWIPIAGSGQQATRSPKSMSIPTGLAKYDTVAKVLADAQRLGVTHIGFTGIDQYN